jgi:hypothetical protein
MQRSHPTHWISRAFNPFDRILGTLTAKLISDMMSGKSPIIKRLVQTTRKNWLNHVQNQAGE